MFQKCGQKDNIKYTFGLRKEQRDEIKVEKEAMVTMYCASCSEKCRKGSIYCPHCGSEL